MAYNYRSITVSQTQLQESQNAGSRNLMELLLGLFAAPAEVFSPICYGANNLYHPEIGPQLPLYLVGKGHEVYESFPGDSSSRCTT